MNVCRPQYVDVRRIESDDLEVIDAALALIREAHHASPMKKYTLKESVIVATLTNRDSRNVTAGWMLWDRRKTCNTAFGIYCVFLQEHPFYSENSVNDFVLYIRPRYRGNLYSAILISECVKWAKNLPVHVSCIYQGVLTGNAESIAACHKSGFYRTPSTTLRKKLFDN